MYKINKALIVAALCTPLIAQSLMGDYRLVAETVSWNPTRTLVSREATEVVLGSKRECEQVAKEGTKRVRVLSDNMANTEFNIICYQEGEKDEYGSVYAPGDRKTFVLQRRELQTSIEGNQGTEQGEGENH